MDRDEIMRVLKAFQAAGLEYVLIGAAAMAFHGLIRTTQDLDLFIRATEENVERLRSALRAVYPRTIRTSARFRLTTCSEITLPFVTFHPAVISTWTCLPDLVK
jgi:hypothetical protein